MQQIPRQFGPYAILSQIGSGGMGAIYRAMDTRLEREVALKVLHRNLGVSGARERFVNEARLVSSLSHPNICTVFDIGEQGEDLFLVMEMLRGQSLKERIAAGPMTADEIRSVALQTALALEAAHGSSIVHRDIKPANIFLVQDDPAFTRVKVLDFGLAKHGRDPREARNAGLTRHGATVGTVEYMSPEQACGYETDARSDLFSLGAVLYEMATGDVPFRGATSAIIYSELLNRDPVPARDANLDLPPDLDWTIQQLLRKDRGERLQTASELVQRLRQRPSGERGARRSTAVRTPTQAHALLAPKQSSDIRFLEATSHSAESILTPATFIESRARPPVSHRRTALRILLSCAAGVLLALTVRIAWATRDAPHAFRGTLQVEPLWNGTGDIALDTVASDLLVQELGQSAAYTVFAAAGSESRSGNSRPEGVPKAVVTGSILPGGRGYAIHVEVQDGPEGQKIAESDEDAPSLEQIPAAISRAAAGVRNALEPRIPSKQLTIREAVQAGTVHSEAP